jgi:chromosome segregation ATPase
VNQVVSKTQSSRERSPSTSSSDSEDDVPDAASDDEAALPPSTQYEIIRDAGFEHLKDMELEEQRATERFLARKQQIGENHAADNGIIEEITCINFMCHKKLHVKLGPLINFVVGENGSGKSAVLTAITLCLGGKASATNRGASLKSLIKEGEDQALLIVKVKNGGTDAYMRDLFGDSITVERSFSRTGSSGFKLKNAMNRIVSTKKGDVDDLIEHYNMQVDNPMNILTQDKAKTFIQTSTPKQKYEFFVEGVQLQQLDNDYKLVSELCDQIADKLKGGKDDIQALSKNVKIAKEKLDVAQQHSGMRKEFRRLAEQTAWAQVEQQEAELAGHEELITGIETQIVRAQMAADDQDQRYQQTNDAFERAQELVRQLEEEAAPLGAEEEAAREANEKAKSELQRAHYAQRTIQDSMKAAKQKVLLCEKDINGEQKRMEEANGGAHARKLDETQTARQNVSETRASLDRNETEKPRLEGELRAAQDELERADSSLAGKRREIEECSNRLDSLNRDRTNVMAGYDRKMPTLLKNIREDRGFREQPVGPIGRHIKLLNPVWSAMLESTIGMTLNGFIVTSKADQMRLSGIMQRLQMQHFCPIMIGNHHPINTAGHEPDPEYVTILRVLEIDHDLVRNQLIINQGIEQSLLIRDRREAYNTMYSGPKPRNVRQCFAMHDTRKDAGHRLAYTGRHHDNPDMGGVKFNPRQMSRMSTDVESQVAIQRETLAQLQREMSGLENNRRVLQQKQTRCQQLLSQHKNAQRQLTVELQRAMQTVENLQAEYDQSNIEDGRIDFFKEQLAEAQQELTIAEESYGAAALEKEGLNETSTTKKRELDAVKARVAEHAAKIHKAQIKTKNTGQARKLALTEKNQAIEAIEALQNKKETAERKRDRQAAVVADYVAQAANVCPRVPIDEGQTYASLEAKVLKLQNSLNEYKKRLGGTEDQLNERYIEARRVFDSARTSYEGLRELLLLLKKSFNQRMKMYRRFQKFISCRSRINFNYLLSERAFRGKLSIDYKHKLLDVSVEPDETTKSSKGRATKTLSGGEKSFSSICLLLALWEAMGAPLRCLDEYDVFMDNVNRDVSSKMIVGSSCSSLRFFKY